jgi:hypothetical protein
VAGEYIDTTIGVMFCTSTLFAAGIGSFATFSPTRQMTWL